MSAYRLRASLAPANKLLCGRGIDSHLALVLKPITVYKKVALVSQRKGSYAVIELLLLPGAVVRLSESSGKCRADHAFAPRRTYRHRVRSIYTPRFTYPNEDMVFPNCFDLWDSECSNGVHFFFDKTLAEQWA